LHYSTGDNPITRGIELSKHDRGKVFAFVNRFDVGNEQHAQITVGTHRHGRETFTFNSFTKSRANKPAWIDYPKPKPIAPPPLKDDNEWRIKAFEVARAFESANGANVPEHPYILKKGVNVADADIRLCNGLLQYAFYDIDDKLKGYQTITSEGVKRPVIKKTGDKNGAFTVIGNADMVRFGAIFVEGLATGLSTFHSEVLNPNKLPVIVCLDANNMRKVVAAFVEKYGNDCVNLYADNDCGLNAKGEFTGNTGVYTALEICNQHGIKSYRLPIMDGAKCDFNDTESFDDCAVPTGIDYQLAIIATAPLNAVTKKYGLFEQFTKDIIRDTRIDAKTTSK
jgi:hypothetical protein